MSRQTPQPDLVLRAGTAFLVAAGLLAAAHGGAQGRAAPSAARVSGAAAPGAPDVPGRGSVEVRRAVYLMGTRLEARVRAGDRGAGLRALERAFEAVEAEEALLSTWRDDTELARLNAAAAGTPVRVSGRLRGRLERAWHIARATGGAFDPAVGALADAWDLRGDGRRPSRAQLASARRASGTDCFELAPDGRVLPRCEGAWIDAGAFGKGSALGRARRALAEAGAEAALLDFGGQLLALGTPPGRNAWPVAVAHPARRDRPVVRLRLRDRSAATTSASERFVTVDGEARGHVLDPRTGRPAPAWGSVTVVAEDPLRADALSTALFVMGPDEARAWARGHEDVGVLLLLLEDREEGGRDAGDARPTRDPLPPSGPDGVPGITACWNRAMERHLAVTTEGRRCPRPVEPDEPDAAASRARERDHEGR